MTSNEISAASGDLHRDVRPPIEMESAPPPDAADGLPLPLRRTAQCRPTVSPLLAGAGDGRALDDPQARRWWSALLGPGAVADLLRLATAAHRGRSLPRPVHMDQLARAGLVRFTDRRVEVVAAFPAMPAALRRRLHPSLRREHP